MATEKKQKTKLAMKDPQKTWRIIEHLTLDDEGLTIAELEADLREVGYNPDECLNQIFQAAEKIARQPNQSGHVSQHISDVLSQLSRRHRSKTKPAGPAKEEEARSVSAGENQQAVAVRTSYQNYKGTSEKDRKILDAGEKFLREKAKKLAQKNKPDQ